MPTDPQSSQPGSEPQPNSGKYFAVLVPVEGLARVDSAATESELATAIRPALGGLEQIFPFHGRRLLTVRGRPLRLISDTGSIVYIEDPEPEEIDADPDGVVDPATRFIHNFSPQSSGETKSVEPGPSPTPAADEFDEPDPFEDDAF